jgi:hypothetical protein
MTGFDENYHSWIHAEKWRLTQAVRWCHWTESDRIVSSMESVLPIPPGQEFSMLLDLCHGNSLQGILELLDAGTLVLLGGASRALYERCDDSQLWPMLFAVQWCNLTSYRPNRLDYLRRSRQERQELERQEQAAQPYLAEWGVEPDPVPFIDLTRDDAVQVSHSLSPHCLLLFVPCRMNLQRSSAGWRQWDQKLHGELSLLQPPIGAVTYWTRNQVDGLPDVATSPV